MTWHMTFQKIFFLMFKSCCATAGLRQQVFNIITIYFVKKNNKNVKLYFEKILKRRRD